MHIIDSRRLIGPNMMMERAGAIAEVAFDAGEDPDAALALWRAELDWAAQEVGLALGEVHVRRFSGGAALCFAAPLDVLLAASDLNDLAIARATARLFEQPLEPLDGALGLLRESTALQKNPRLLELSAEARARDLPLLLDDNLVTLGMGARSRSYPMGALPLAQEVPWSELARVPTALVTGTNGKTTSARLLAHLCAQAGKRVGLAATDFVSIDGAIVERGDFTGPAAARLVLRDPRTEIAVLETARGGILRRGLAFDRADCALITNIADDHLGEYGIDSVAALARAKGVVARAVDPQGKIALNADDEESVALLRDAPELFRAALIWFSLHPLGGQASGPVRELLAKHVAQGGDAMLLEDGWLVHYMDQARFPLLEAKEIPIAFQGAAAFNIANALGATALAFQLGLSRESVVRGLRSFRSDAQDNPGRGNLFAGPRGVRVLVDFGHNAHAVHHVALLVANLLAQKGPGGELSTIAACAGDRSDENLRALARELAAMGPRRVYLRDLPDYLRGRAPGEVPAKLRALLEREHAIPPPSIELHASEAGALAAALDAAWDGELILLLVHLDEDEVHALLKSRGFRPA